jgi:hypothetical protein
MLRMTTTLRQLVRFGRETSSGHSVEELQALIDRLTAERQRLRAERASHDLLEQNRLEIARAQWELSHALIDRHLHAA